MSAAIRDEWSESNPLGRLICPQALYCTLTGRVLRDHLTVANVYSLPRTLRCIGCEATFRYLDRDYNEFVRIAAPRFKDWSIEVPAFTPKFNVPQQDPAEIDQSELVAIQHARQEGNLEVIIEMEFAVSAETALGIKQFSQKFTFPSFVLIEVI